MRLFCLWMSAATLLTATVSAQDAVKEKAETKTTEVQLKDLSLKIPQTWKTAPGSRMRLATYGIPKVEGDEDNAELSIFNFGGGGGSLSDNITRWIGQFDGTGRTTKVTKGMAGENEYVFVDIAGTYKKPKPGSPPFRQETIAAPDYRMHGVILTVKDKGVYYLKVAGPDKTVKAAATDFRASFGGDVKSEKDHEL